MEILLIFPGFIFAYLVALLCECKIKQILKEQRNKVHFYVARDKDGELCLYLGKPVRCKNEFYWGTDERADCLTRRIKNYGLKEEDYDYLKWEDEPVEVFLNLED